MFVWIFNSRICWIKPWRQLAIYSYERTKLNEICWEIYFFPIHEFSIQRLKQVLFYCKILKKLWNDTSSWSCRRIQNTPQWPYLMHFQNMLNAGSQSNFNSNESFCEAKRKNFDHFNWSFLPRNFNPKQKVKSPLQKWILIIYSTSRFSHVCCTSQSIWHWVQWP